ncbi:MAG: hypothetical protein ABIP55_09090 [Tepidisphaeraceae bacterium]
MRRHRDEPASGFGWVLFMLATFAAFGVVFWILFVEKFIVFLIVMGMLASLNRAAAKGKRWQSKK